MSAWGDNEEIFARLAGYLNERADFVTAGMVGELRALGIDEAEAYALLLASACGLNVDESADHRALYRRYFPKMAARLRAADFQSDPYLRAVCLPEASEGAWTLANRSYAPYEAFVRDEPLTLPDGRVIPQIGYFAERFCYPAVLENGREWMTVTPNEINTMRPAVEAARGRVLAYGLGLGYFAFMAARKENVASVTVVERDPAAIRLFQRHVLPFFERPDKLALIRDDAFHYAQSAMPDGRFDMAFTDLWHDPSDGVPLYRRMKALEPLSPGTDFLYWIEKTITLYA